MRAIYREIISSCLSLEQPLRIAFLGPVGTYSQQAAKTQFGSGAELHPFASIDAVFDEVERGRTDYGVVPVENSTEGVVAQTLDRFVSSPLTIKAEVVLRIDHCLLAREARPRRLRRIVSHPQSLAQCRTWLSQHYPGVPLEEVASNAVAAATAAQQAGTGAIASRQAAERYGLSVIATSIQDLPNNVTRFLVISGDGDGAPTGDDKTSVLFAVPHRGGCPVRRPRGVREGEDQPQHHRVPSTEGTGLGVRLLPRPGRPHRRTVDGEGAGRVAAACPVRQSTRIVPGLALGGRRGPT